MSEKVEAIGASVFSLKSDVQNMTTMIDQIDARMSRVETNVKSIADLLRDFVTSMNDLHGAFDNAQRGLNTQPDKAEHVRKPDDAGHVPDDTGHVPEDAGHEAEDAGREPEEPDQTDETIVYEGDEHHKPSKASTVAPPVEESSKVQATSGGEESSVEAAVVVKMKASGPAASRLSPCHPQKAARSPPKTTAELFSREETEEEVPLSKVMTPKKSRPFANMAMPQKPLARKDSLWRCNICNVSTFRSQSAFDKHWNLQWREGGLECCVCRKVLSDRQNFRQHMLNQHGLQAKDIDDDVQPKVVPKPKYPCHVAGCVTVCSSKDSRMTHKCCHRETVGDKTCSYCSKVYCWKVDHVGHEKVCEADPNSQQKVCKFPGCGVVVSTSGNLRKHDRCAPKEKGCKLKQRHRRKRL